MARKPATLHQIRRQVSAKSRSISSVTNGSAFRRIERRNERFEHGRSFRTKEEGAEFPRFVEPKKMKKVAARKKTNAAKPTTKRANESTETTEAQPYWRPAGGDAHFHGDDIATKEPTLILGIARVPVFALEKFKSGLKTVLEQHGEVQDLVVQEVKDGQEELADVYAVFRSELVAAFVRDEVEGLVVEGRRIRVTFA